MTHAIYAFLIPIEDPDANNESLAEESVRLFEDRFNDRLDENNWYQEDCLVLRNGRVVNLDPDGGSRFELFGDAEQVPQDKRYKWARLTALRCVATELELGGRLSSVIVPPQLTPTEAYWDDFDSLMAQIMTEVPPRLAALWAKGPMLPTTNDSDGNWVDRYCRNVLGRQMLLLLWSIDHEPPFASDGSPYEYRAFDVSWGSDNEDHNAILFVDIHT